MEKECEKLMQEMREKGWEVEIPTQYDFDNNIFKLSNISTNEKLIFEFCQYTDFFKQFNQELKWFLKK